MVLATHRVRPRRYCSGFDLDRARLLCWISCSHRAAAKMRLRRRHRSSLSRAFFAAMNTAGLLSLEAQALFGLVSLVLVATAPVRGSAVEPRRPGQESFLTRAVFADERLWVLSDAGELSSIREGRDERVEESLPESALDLCLRDGHPMVITCQRDGCTNWTLRRWVSGKWSVD